MEYLSERYGRRMVVDSFVEKGQKNLSESGVFIVSGTSTVEEIKEK